jgi:hypothetical protein
MIPRRRPAGLLPRALLAIAAATLVASACGLGGAAATFDPSAPCTTDQRVPGAYADLEARIPATFRGRPPTTLDSGRNCSTDALGSLVAHDVREIHFAGGVWDLGNGTGVTLALLALPDARLPVAWAEEFYEIGARTAKRTENIEVRRQEFASLGTAAFRLDTLNDLSLQTVVVWADGPIARVAIVASPVTVGASRAVHDSLVEEAVAAGVAAPRPSASP